MLAEWTGLEPATPGVTGRYSNQLNYHSRICWWVLRGSNSRHSPCKGDALPTELSTRVGAVGACFLIQNAELRPAAVLLISDPFVANPSEGGWRRQSRFVYLILEGFASAGLWPLGPLCAEW